MQVSKKAIKKGLDLTLVVAVATVLTGIIALETAATPLQEKGTLISARLPITASTQEQAIEAGKQQSTPEVLDFYADWCLPCKLMEKDIHKAEKKLKDKVNFTKVDISDPANKELVAKYAVSSIPTLIFLNEKRQVVSAVFGYSPSELKWALKTIVR